MSYAHKSAMLSLSLGPAAFSAESISFSKPFSKSHVLSLPILAAPAERALDEALRLIGQTAGRPEPYRSASGGGGL